VPTALVLHQICHKLDNILHSFAIFTKNKNKLLNNIFHSFGKIVKNKNIWGGINYPNLGKIDAKKCRRHRNA